MYKDLSLKDQLKIVRNAIKNNKDPKLAIKNYDRSENGGYALWYKEALPLGIDPNKYDIKQFYNDNPEDAWNIIQGKSNGELLLLYKTPLEIQKENLILQQRKRNTLNDLMDYTQYEKLINDYMNKSINISSCGGPVSINMYAEGTDNLNEKRTDITKFGTLESEYKDTRTPNFIDITPEELQNFINDSGRTITIDIPKDNLEGVPEEYKNLPKTRFIRIPYKFLKDRNYNVDDLKEDEAITYYLLDFNENDEYGNPKEYYTIRKVNKHTPVGRAYDYWKRDQKLGNVLNSDWLYKDDKNIKEGPVDINNTVLLSDVTVTPENNKQFESDTAIPGEYNQQEKYIDPFNIGGTELNVPNNALYNTQGTKGGSSFGTSTDGLRMPDIFNMNMLDLPYAGFQYTPYLWQLENLEYLNPPGYVPIPNWNVALVYDIGAEGADFADFMKMLAGYGRDNSLRDELMAKLFEPKDYFADPYAGSHYTDTQSFYDAYDNNPYNRIQRESNGIPLYANGGKVNIFDGYGSSYIPRGMREVGKADDGTFIYTATPDIMRLYYPDLFNLAPSSLGYMFLGKGDNNYTPMRSSEHRYDKFIDYNKLNEIKNNTNNEETYINLPEIEVTPQSSTTVYPELSTYDDNATAANAYNADSELVKPNIERYTYWDPVNKLARWRQNKQELDRKWFTNEDATRFLTNAGLTLMGGAAAWTKPLHFALGMLGMEAGNNYVDWLVNQSDSPYSSWSEMALKKWNLPDFAADLSNPGGWIGGSLAGFGIKNPKLESSIPDMYNFGKQIILDKSFRNNIIGDLKSNLQLYNLKNGLPKSEYLQIIEDANPYPNRLAQYNFKIPANEYTESAKQHLNVGPMLDWKSFKKSVKDANELIFHGNINKLRKVQDKIKATDKELRNILNSQDKLEYDIAMAGDMLYDIQQKHFSNNPYYDIVKLSDLTQADINDAIQTELPNNYPYDVVYNNGEFLFIPKGSTDVEFSIPQFGTENWVTGTTSSIPYYNLGILGKQISIGKSPFLGTLPPETKGIQNTSFGQMLINHSPEILIPLEGTGYSTMLNAAELTYKTSNLAGETSKTYETAPTLSKEAKEVTLKNMEYVEQKELPGFKTFGSAKTSTEGAVAKAAGDIDGYMAKSDFDKLPQDKRSRMSTVNGDTYQYQIDSTGKKKYAVRDKNGNIVTDSKGKQNDWGVIDINIVDVDKKGYGNKRAELIFRQFFPEEYHKAVIELNTNKKHNGRLPIIDMNGKPLTDKLLMEAYDPLVGSIIDAMEANFLHNPTYKGKHAARWFNYLIGDRPDSISKALSQVTKMMYGKNGVKLPKMKFGTPQENELILIELGYPKEAAHIIAKDNAKMQNALDYWYIADRGTYRQVYPDSSGSTIGTPQTINRNLTNWNISTGGGTAAGGGLNTTIEGNSNAWGSIAGRTQPKIIGLKDGMTPRLVIDEVNYLMGISPVQQTDINALNAMGITHNLLVGDDISLLHKVLSPSKLEWEWNPGDEQIFNQYLNMTGRRGIVNQPYGEGRFWGSGPIDPISDALGINSSLSSAYDIMSLANRKLFLEQLGGSSATPKYDAASIINTAARKKAQPGYDKAIQEFRKNSKEYLEIEKEIDETQKELNKLGRDFSATIDAQQKYDKLQLKLHETRLKRYKVLKKLINGAFASSIAGIGAAATYYKINDNDDE